LKDEFSNAVLCLNGLSPVVFAEQKKEQFPNKERYGYSYEQRHQADR